ncbi:MAG: hypothetical protein GX294_00275, partial [Candidatus Cloacimonetes bacterium]|nr:hypothetical protein [Candidatus Cloacimonadota bacterium]
YISHFEVRVYRDEVLFFSGIIDTSQLSFDVETGVLNITCYDKIKLFSIYADLVHYYGQTAGYLPQWILAYFIQDIEARIPIKINSYSGGFELPVMEVEGGDPLTLARVDYAKLLERPPGYGWVYTYHPSGWSEPYCGYRYDPLSGSIVYLFAHKVIVQADYSSPVTTRWQGRYLGRIVRIFNGICVDVKEHGQVSGWVEDLAQIDSDAQALIDFFVNNGVAENSLYNLSEDVSHDGREYSQEHEGGEYVEVKCSGNIMPTRIHPGNAYLTYRADTTESIRVLQAMLMMYNATILTDKTGRVILKNKDKYDAAVIDINSDDVVKFSTKRGNHENPDMNILDVLAGDAAFLKEKVRDYLVGFYDAKWSCDALIDDINKYNLELQSKIRIEGKTYAITEIERDYQKDEYKVKAWLI